MDRIWLLVIMFALWWLWTQSDLLEGWETSTAFARIYTGTNKSGIPRNVTKVGDTSVSSPFKAGSLSVKKGYKVTLYPQTDYKGDAVEFADDVLDLSMVPLLKANNNMVGSYRVAPLKNPEVLDWTTHTNTDAVGNDIACLLDGTPVSECITKCADDPSCVGIAKVAPGRGGAWGKGACCYKRSLTTLAEGNSSDVTFYMGPTKGRYVKIYHTAPKGILHISTLRVFSNGKNVAKGKKFTQSSIWSGYPASNLDDDNDDTFGHTSGQDAGWFLVDLGSTVPIDEILVVNRRDCCTSRIGGAKIDILNEAKQVIYTSNLFPKRDGTTNYTESGMGGWLTYTVKPPWATVIPGPTPPIYRMVQGLDSKGNDFGQLKDWSIEGLMNWCQREDCRGFNTDGWMKYKMVPPAQMQKYTKNSWYKVDPSETNSALTGTYQLGPFGINPWKSASKFVDPKAQWIWNIPGAAAGAPTSPAVKFTKRWNNNSSSNILATLHVIADDAGTVYLNGKKVADIVGGGWTTPNYSKMSVTLVPGPNTFEIVANNGGGYSAGLIASLIKDSDKSVILRTDSSWVSQ